MHAHTYHMMICIPAPSLLSTSHLLSNLEFGVQRENVRRAHERARGRASSIFARLNKTTALCTYITLLSNRCHLHNNCYRDITLLRRITAVWWRTADGESVSPLLLPVQHHNTKTRKAHEHMKIYIHLPMN